MPLAQVDLILTRLMHWYSWHAYSPLHYLQHGPQLTWPNRADMHRVEGAHSGIFMKALMGCGENSTSASSGSSTGTKGATDAASMKFG